MDDLIDHWRTWLEGHASRSVPGLAQKTGLATSTIRRIMNGEQTPNEETARSILRVTASDPSEYVTLLNKAFPSSNEHLSYVAQALQGATATDIAVEFYKEDALGFEIFVATTSSIGYCEKALIKKLGENGAARIEQLLDDGSLTLKNGRLYSKQVLFTSKQSILDACDKTPRLVKMNADKLSGQYFYASRYTESDLRKIANATIDFIQKMDEINANREPLDKTCKPSCVSIVFGSIEGES
ncbi:helix-turn-helix domain-containing protein [Pseudobacteriovorax antillogorgiicola]|uniref:Helix-turn-helix n=1 Tax=Pseudobacteriovorax antillogorgiicola TaxID=1513793 RepID=A0A1Y6BKE8_9BACT|nr:helix-turn-helix transcriptional regulator [Pseudobacteriovorax antillogorgiicola]TCS56304.1 helix-turn-helix protein [Pseudobacteriovorax antillogorgiicola]SMF07309.1 Helix-turn-helix [Pseudobacteriovorax antillogorgiicola]